jgi:gamma-D-glutamyl-L-lysine dipeptidyl-peptidase
VSARGWEGAVDAAGAVRVGVAGLRAAPAHAAELTSQALLGETFRVLGAPAPGDWLRVRLDADGYEGWLRAWAAVPAAPTEAGGPRTAVRVAVREVVVRSAPRRGAPALVVAPWQARLRAGTAAGAWAPVALPDGREGFVPRAALDAASAPGGRPTASRLLRTAARMIGIPYLWGGRSVWGYDCSGFVQAVLGWHGVALPRDARDQFRALADGRVRSGGRLGPGDGVVPAGSLLFFGAPGAEAGHVAVGAGGLDFLHAYGEIGRGSLDPACEAFVGELVSQYLGAWKGPFSGIPEGPSGLSA